jgi:hypothetical protein
MAEYYFMATGPLMWLRNFEQGLAAQAWTIPGVAPNGTPFTSTGGGLLEPIQLYRVISPKDAMPLFIRTLRRNKSNPKGLSSLPVFALRKAMGLQEVPDIGNPQDGPVLAINTDHLQIIPIGYKEDEFGIIPTTGVYQEKI